MDTRAVNMLKNDALRFALRVKDNEQRVKIPARDYDLVHCAWWDILVQL